MDVYFENWSSTSHLQILTGTMTPKDKEIVDNNLKLCFTHKTQLLNLLYEYNAIPCQHLPPFVTFLEVSIHLQHNAQTIGKYSIL